MTRHFTPSLPTSVLTIFCLECLEIYSFKTIFRDIKIPGQLSEPVAAEIPMVHNIPELRVSVEVIILCYHSFR